ncbi:hypothetical protein [Pseudomonas kurunegalensis]|uniref:hypothetical protein n=1 Tax=Pseudomonas kurunegalensis TaxID=485880 RepID=UPI002364714A|nr:hypothetical protein [Pseudomonas kurunegalensis]MDD2134848.1 hypothetical protein [Pseudomonas kurunegalensis]
MKSTIANLYSTMTWLRSIGNKITRIVPGFTAAIIIATLTSQASLLLAYFLPLKVIILFGSAGIPSYFPSQLKAIDKNHLIIALTLATAFFYLLNMLCEQIISRCADLGGRKILQRSRKITLFINQDEIVALAYQRYARSLASTFFLILTCTALGYVYPRLLSVLAGFLFISFVVISLTESTPNVKSNKATTLNSKLIGTISSIAFLSAFVFIVIDFMLGSAPTAMIEIISLILVRQITQRAASLTLDVSTLSTQRLQINALFFHGHLLLEDTSKHEMNFLAYLEEPQRTLLLRQVLTETLKVPVNSIESSWHQTATGDIVAFEVSLPELEQDHTFLVKIFNTNRRDQALQEATLLAECSNSDLPAFETLGVSVVDDLQCHVFKYHSQNKISLRELRVKSQEAMARMLEVEPPRELVARYERSRPYIWKRINNSAINRLRLAATTPEQQEQLNQLSRVFEHILGLIQTLPLQIVNPELTADTIYVTEEGKLMLSQWGRWSIEPLGFGWGTGPTELTALESALRTTTAARPKLSGVNLQHVKLSALISAFERTLQRQQFMLALNMLPVIISLVESSEAIKPER